MLNLSNISLIAVDTQHPTLAVWAMVRCLQQAHFAEAVLVTHRGYALPATAQTLGIRVEVTDSVRSIEDYSRFMLTALPSLVSADHVLVVQWDGFIVNPQCWTDEFLAYDYIGALWRKKPGQHRVGNGGFSLRSRRLLLAIQTLAPAVTHPEDGVIGGTLRDRLSAEFGIRFAPDGLAERFAFERDRLSFPSFGFHRYANFPLVLDREALREFLALAPDSVVTVRGVSRFVRYCTERGMGDVAREVLTRRQQAGHGHMLGNAFMRAWTHLAPSR